MCNNKISAVNLQCKRFEFEISLPGAFCTKPAIEYKIKWNSNGICWINPVTQIFRVRKFKCNKNYSETMSLENSCIYTYACIRCMRGMLRWDGSAWNYVEQYNSDDMSAKFKVKRCHPTAEKYCPCYVDSKVLYSSSKVLIVENYWH